MTAHDCEQARVCGGVGSMRVNVRVVSAVTLLLTLAWAAKADAQPTATVPRSALLSEVLAGLSASAVSQVGLEHYALAGLDGLADFDKCLGRRGNGAQVVLTCGARTATLPWPPTTTNDAAQLLSETVHLLSGRGTSDLELERRVARALARSVDDPFTAYLPPEIVSLMAGARAANFLANPGIEVWPRDPSRVREVARGSSAQREGVLAGDTLVTIDDTNTNKLTFPEISALLAGSNDSIVRIVLRNEDGDARKVLLTRVTAPDSAVTHRVLDEGVLYVSLPSFTQGVASRVSKIVRDAQASGVILDLRHNGGGLVPEGVAVADVFLRDGPIGGVRSGPGRPSEQYVAHRETTDITYPLVLIVDGATASASELVSMVLKERGRATVIGTTTAGKGSVQRQIHLPDGGMLKVTAGYYVGPSGTRLDEGGVKPDRYLAPAQSRTVPEGGEPNDDSWVQSALDVLEPRRENTVVGPGPEP